MKTIKDTFTKTYFKLYTDKDALSYLPGDTVKFTLKLFGDGEQISAPFIEYEIHCDEDKNRTEKGCLDGSKGEIEFGFQTTAPGFIKVDAFALDENKNRINVNEPVHGGACAGFDDIKQYKEEPQDFDKFWKDSLALLPSIESVSARVITREIFDKVPEGYRLFEVVVPAVDDNSRPATAIVSYPTNAKEGSLRLRCSFQGYGIASPLPIFLPDCIAFCVSSHGFAIGMPDYYYNYDHLGLQGFGFKNNDKPETVYFRNMILRDVQMVRYAMTHPLWNGKDLWCVGGSMGAFQTSAVCALMNEFVTEVTVNINWMCEVGGEEVRLNGWRPKYTEALRYYDTINFAKRIKAPITICEAGLGDYVSPPSGITSYYNAVRDAGNTGIKITFIQNRAHGGETRPDAELITFSREHKI